MRRLVGTTIIALAGLSGCSYSSYQSAKTMPQGGTSVGAAITQYGYHGSLSENDEAVELMGSHALADNFELGGKFAWFNEEDINVYNFLVAPKVALIPNQLAFTAPTGIVLIQSDSDFIDDSENVWLTEPGVVFGIPINPALEVDLAGKWVMELADDFSDYNGAVAANAGLHITLPNTTFSLMPEIGVLWDNDDAEPDDHGYFLQIGFAFGYEFLPPGAAIAAAPPSAGPPGAIPAQ